jgi:hypothetical protein
VFERRAQSEVPTSLFEVAKLLQGSLQVWGGTKLCTSARRRVRVANSVLQFWRRTEDLLGDGRDVCTVQSLENSCKIHMMVMEKWDIYLPPELTPGINAINNAPVAKQSMPPRMPESLRT